jgi:hypothetical protein
MQMKSGLTWRAGAITLSAEIHASHRDAAGASIHFLHPISLREKVVEADGAVHDTFSIGKCFACLQVKHRITYLVNCDVLHGLSYF